MALSSLMMNGCVTKTEFANKQTRVNKITPIYATAKHSDQNVWKKVASFKKSSSIQKEDCPDCYAKPLVGSKIAKVAKTNNFNLKSNEVLSFDYSKAPADTFNNTVDYSKPPSASFSNMPKVRPHVAAIDTSSYDAYDYTVTPDDTYIKREAPRTMQLTQQISYVNSSQGGYSSKTAVQIGAFRRYAGAMSYAKKYDLLSGKYHVEIKTGLKDKKPIHRVRIEGFSTRSEAKKFIARYGINDAFLVRR